MSLWSERALSGGLWGVCIPLWRLFIEDGTGFNYPIDYSEKSRYCGFGRGLSVYYDGYGVGSQVKVASGTFTSSNVDGVYTFQIDFKLEDGNTFSGTFTGTL